MWEIVGVSASASDRPADNGAEAAGETAAGGRCPGGDLLQGAPPGGRQPRQDRRHVLLPKPGLVDPTLGLFQCGNRFSRVPVGEQP